MSGDITTGQFVAAWAIAALVSLAVFLHANRHGSRHATAWGICVFLFLAIALPAYVVHFWTVRRRRRF